jgi:hypothetical protein
MSVATEFPPAVYIPERARQTASGRPGSAERHLALVPAGRPRGAQGSRTSCPPAPTRAPRLGKSNFNNSGIEWPLTVAPAARPMRLTRRGMVVAIVATLIAGLAMLLVAHASASSPSTAPKVAVGATMIVQPGDTLWSIAQRVEPNRDPRRVVDQLRQLNHLTSVALSAGQTLKLG